MKQTAGLVLRYELLRDDIILAIVFIGHVGFEPSSNCSKCFTTILSEAKVAFNQVYTILNITDLSSIANAILSTVTTSMWF